MYINNESGERRTQAERRAATRRALSGAARLLFAERGYHGIAAEEIVGRGDAGGDVPPLRGQAGFVSGRGGGDRGRGRRVGFGGAIWGVAGERRPVRGVDSGSVRVAGRLFPSGRAADTARG